MNKRSDIDSRTEMFAVKDFLEVFQPKAITQRFAHTETQPKRSSRVRIWRRYLPLPETNAPITEGITPESYRVLHQDISVQLAQFGGIVEITDVIEDVVDDPIMKITGKLLARQAVQVIEKATISVITAGTNATFAGGTSRATVAGTITRDLLRGVVRQLDRAGAEPISQMIAPTSDVATQGVEESFYAMAHTDLDSDLRNITEFITYAEYGTPSSRVMGEVGSIERIRFVLNQNFVPWELAGVSGTTFLSGGDSSAGGAGNADVYPIVIVGQDAYAAVRLQHYSTFEMFVMNPGVARGGDPLGQRGTVGWKTWYACKILTENYMHRLEVGVTN